MPEPAARDDASPGELGQSLVGRQLQAAQGAVDQLLQAPAIFGLQLLLHVHQLLEVVITVDVLRQMVIARQQLANAGQAFGNHVEHRALVGTRQLLRQLADLQSRGAPDFTVVGHLVALDQTQHARFAGAVAADDAHPLAPCDLPGHSIEQGMAP